MYIDTSTYDQSLSIECLHWEMNLLFFHFSNGKHTVWHVCSKILDSEGKYRESPPLDRLLADRCRDTDKIDGIILQYMSGEEISTKNRGDM